MEEELERMHEEEAEAKRKEMRLLQEKNARYESFDREVNKFNNKIKLLIIKNL